MMERSLRSRNRLNHNLQKKSSSLYFLNHSSNFNSTENLDSDTFNWRDSYTFNPVILGRGHFSKVYKAKCSVTGKYVAIKVIRRRRLGVDQIDDIMKEIEIMQIFQISPNSPFIQLIKYHISNTEVAVLMEFAPGGSIYNVVRDSETGLPESYTKIILSKIISALSVMHGHNIVHLDIKADNILLRHAYPSTDVALADFGLARKLSKTKVHKEMIGTPDYIAPEISNYDCISTKSDMWSVGVLTYFILTNVSPFCADTKEETLNRVTKAQFEFVGHLENDNMHLVREFIKSLLVKIPEQRYNAEQCLNHDFLSSVSLVEYLPITQQQTDKILPTINITADTDAPPFVRENTNFKFRALVTSQYELESLYNKSSLAGQIDGIVKHNSTNCIENIDRSSSSCDYKTSEERDNSYISEEKPSRNIDDSFARSLDSVKINLGPDKEKESLNERNSYYLNIYANDNKICLESDSTKDTIDFREMDLEDKHETKPDTVSSATEPLNTSLSEITCSFNDTPNNEDMSSRSSSIHQEAVPVGSYTKTDIIKESNKENHGMKNIKYVKDSKILINNSFNNTKVYDSRRRIHSSLVKSQLDCPSFRYSRNDLVNANYDNEQFSDQMSDKYDVHTCREYNTIPIRATRSKIKKRPLTKSVKRDFDKPSDNVTKRSLSTTRPNCVDGTLKNDTSISKSQPVLNEIRADSSKHIKTTNKLSNTSKTKKHKNNDNKPWKCIIS